MRVLFLVPHSLEGASSRYRVFQYIPYLEEQGIECTVSSFLSNQFYKVAYSQGHPATKIGCFISSVCRRFRDVIRSGGYDLVVIHREAFPIGPPLYEWLLSLRKVPIVFDMDDAIFLPRINSPNAMIRLLRRHGNIDMILRWSHSVIVSNVHLAQYAYKFNPNVYVIPTSVDTRRFCVPAHRPKRSRLTIGWIGSHSTASYLDQLRPVLRQLAEQYDFIFKIVGSTRPFVVPGVEIVQEQWSLEREVSSFQDLDIGVYPLSTDPWVLGKAGFKAILYMAVGVPCIAARIGRNCEIVQDGTNGFLAGSHDEWLDKLDRLLKDPGLRLQFGRAGRQTVEEQFSVEVQAPVFAEVLRKAASGGKKGDTQHRSHRSRALPKFDPSPAIDVPKEEVS